MNKRQAKHRNLCRSPLSLLIALSLAGGVAHDPEWGWLDGANAEWTKRANEAKVDLFIAGHLHRLERIKPGERGNDFTILALGQDQIARVEADERELKVSVLDRAGKVLDAFTLRRRSK